MTELLANFHLLRPWWLLTLPLSVFIYLLWRRRRRLAAHWQRSVDPELLGVLLEVSTGGTGNRRLWPVALFLAAVTTGLSGPTFERLPQPVEQRTDALVIALDLSLSMYAQDVDPSRLVRARQKIVDILRQRREGYTALVAYAGSAHAVAPLTDDTRTIENLLETLEPAMMPVAGSRPNAALEVIENLFANAAVTQGRILFVTDGVDDIAEVSAFRNPYFPISVIGVGTPDGATIPLDFVQQPGRVLTTRDGEAIIARLDDDRLREVAELAYGRYARLTLSDADINTALSTTLPGDEDSEAIDREFDLWHDLGYWFAVLALPCLLFGFRRGVLACCALALLPGASHASLWDDLWQRDDQQAYQAMRNGEPERAATLTERPDWRGAAEYRSGNYNAAISAFSRLDDLTATYNLGNALARSGDLDGAIAAYDKVLDSDPNFEDAAFNKDLIERQREKQQEADQQDNDEKQQESENDSEQSRDGQSDGSQQQDDASPQQGADDSEQKGEEQQQSADSGKQGEPEEGAEEDQADSRSEQADALEQWLRRVPDDPGGLLRRKFQYENQQRLRSGDYRYRQGEKDMVSPRLGCLVLALVLWTVSAVAAVDARVDRTTVDEMQSLQLTLRITGTNDADTLDLAPLEKDFEVQGTSTQSQMRMINGEITAWVDYLVTLRPKRTGTLTIPALDVGGDRSQAITVQVRPVAPELRRQIDRLVYFEVTTDADTVYVQGQLLYTRRLYYTSGVQIYGDLPGAPEVADAVVLPLGETTQNTTMLNDTRYGVLEQRYAIFPEHSGALTIPGFSVASSVRLADGRRGIRVAADDKTITVLPIPAIWPKDVPWLPASALSLSEDWDPDMTNVNAGTSMRRAVQVTVTGNRGSAVPPLITTVDDRLIRQYPEAPVMEDDTRGDRVVGHRQQVESLVPTWGGQVALPGVAVTWWDTASNQVRVNRLPARQLTIAGAPPPTAESPSDNVTPTPADVAPEEAPATVTTPLPTNALRWSGIAVLVLVLAGGVAVLLKRRRPNASTQHEARWLSALRSALKARDGHAVREALLHAVMQRQACGRTRALSLLAEDPDWLRLTAALNNRLAPEATAWTSEIDDAAKRLAARQRIRRRISPGTAPALPPLYPHPGS